MKPNLRAGALLVAGVALAACPARQAQPSQPADAAPSANGASVGVPAGPGAALPEDPEQCLDEVLRQAGLNRFGDPPDTMYAGGTPLFDERTGTRVTRREYAAKKVPHLVARCPEK